MAPEVFKGLTETIQFHRNMANNYAAMFRDELLEADQAKREGWQKSAEWHIAQRMNLEVELETKSKTYGSL
jgi:hypothetical protein